MTNNVAILLSTFNGDKYLDEYLHSLNEQDWHDLTVIVRDDGSTDKTLQLLKRNQEISKLPVQILPSAGHLGAAQSYLRLLDVAGEGFDYYAFGDQDDVWHPDKVTRAMNKLKPASEKIPCLYCSRVEYVDEKLNHLQWSKIPRCIGFGNAIVENVATGCTVVINKSARKFILSSLPGKVLMHDWWFYLTVSCFGQIVFDDYSGIKYRQHSSNAIGAATTFADDLGRRVRRFYRSDGGIFRFSNQVYAFLDSFGDRIPEEQHRILSLVISSKSSINDRVRLVMSRNIWRQRRIDDLILRILITINHY